MFQFLLWETFFTLYGRWAVNLARGPVSEGLFWLSAVPSNAVLQCSLMQCSQTYFFAAPLEKFAGLAMHQR